MFALNQFLDLHVIFRTWSEFLRWVNLRSLRVRSSTSTYREKALPCFLLVVVRTVV
jgi:hypothetical protein